MKKEPRRRKVYAYRGRQRNMFHTRHRFRSVLSVLLTILIILLLVAAGYLPPVPSAGCGTNGGGVKTLHRSHPGWSRRIHLFQKSHPSHKQQLRYRLMYPWKQRLPNSPQLPCQQQTSG